MFSSPPPFCSYISNSSAASIRATWFLTLPCTVLSNDLTWSCWPRVVNHPILMTSKFPSTKCFWLGSRGFYRGRMSDRESEGQRGLQGEWGKEEDICNTIDRYLSPSPLAWKNTRSSMSTEINKRKPPDRSPPPLWFSRGLAVTFPQDKAVTKVTPPSPSLWGKRRVGGGESGWGNLFSNALHPPPHLQGSQERLTESQQRIDEIVTVSLTFSEMHQGVKRWHIPPARCRGKQCHIPGVTVLFVSSDSEGAI